MKKLLLLTSLFAGMASAQWVDFSAFTTSTNLYGPMNGKISVQSGSGAPSGLNCTVGKDLYVDIVAVNLYACSVTGIPGTWKLWTPVYLLPANNLNDLVNVITARGNLGLGSAATQASSAFDVAGAAATAQAAAQASSAQKAANLGDLANVANARTNLGLGTASTQPSSAFDSAGAAAAAQAAAIAAGLPKTNPDLGAAPNGLSETKNVGAGGVTANTLACPDPSAPNQVIACTTSTPTFEGISLDTASAAGTARIVRWGTVQIKADGNWTIGNSAIASVTTAGYIHDTGAGRNSASLLNSVVTFRNTCSSACAGTPALVDIVVGDRGTQIPGSQVSGAVPTATALATSPTPCTTGQIFPGVNASGSSLNCIDFPDVKTIPSANCNGTNGGNGWSIPAGGTVTCRAGTNNLGGYVSITDTSSTFAQFAVTIPEDWDATSRPYIRFQLASADATNAHTIIPAIQVSCAKGDGTTTDDVTFNAVHSLSTVTLNGNANRFWSTSNVQMNSTDVTGCVAGSLMIVSVQRATDTATSAFFYAATITIPRLLTVQAN